MSKLMYPSWSLRDGTYVIWVARIRVVMQIEEWWDAIEPTNSDEKIEAWKEERAFALIHKSIGKEFLPLLVGIETAKEVWEMLGNLKTSTVEEILEARKVHEEEEKMKEETSLGMWHDEDPALLMAEIHLETKHEEEGKGGEELTVHDQDLQQFDQQQLEHQQTSAGASAGASEALGQQQTPQQTSVGQTYVQPSAATSSSPHLGPQPPLSVGESGGFVGLVCMLVHMFWLHLTGQLLKEQEETDLGLIAAETNFEEGKKRPLRQPRSEHEMKMFHSWERESERESKSESELKMVVFEEGRANRILAQEVRESMRTGVIDSKLLFASIVNDLENFDKVPKDEDEDFLWDPG